VKISEAKMLKILMLTLGMIMLITTVWAAVRAEDFNDRALQNLGGIVFGVMAVTFGLKIDESYNTKAALMAGFVLVIGTAFATRELCFMTNDLALAGGGVTAKVFIPFIGVLMGFALSGSSKYLTGRKKSKLIKEIWIIVVISFIGITAIILFRIYDLMHLFGTTPAFYAVLLGYLCYLAIFIYGLTSMFSNEIKYNMKIGVKESPQEPEA